MKPYKRDVPCVKCGTTAPYSKYKVSRYKEYNRVPFKKPEYMERTCRHCGYIWEEFTLDYKEGNDGV